MFAHFSRRGPSPRTAGARLRRLAAVLAAVTCGLLAWAAAVPAAVARVPATTHLIIAGGMAGWQIALIAVGSALVAAIVAVVLDRARAARSAATA